MFHSTYTLMKIQTIHTESKYEYISKTSIFFSIYSLLRIITKKARNSPCAQVGL